MLAEMSLNSSFESLNDTKSDSFQYFPAIIDTEEMENVPIANPAPILTEIVGRWKLVASENLEQFLNDRNTPELEKLFWEHGEPVYELPAPDLVRQHTWLLGKSIQNVYIRVLKPNKLKSSGLNEFVDEPKNCLVSSQLTYKGVEQWRVERVVRDGRLEITHQLGAVSCKRVFERVSL